MSHDGCEPVTWQGQAFPYLIHHPNSFLKTENYGSQRAAASIQGGHGSHAPVQEARSDTLAPAGTGTWHGAAPRGYIRNGVNTAAPPASALAAAPTRQPESLRLSSGQIMPMMGLGTAQIKSADAIKQALELGYRHFDCAEVYANQAVVGEGLKAFTEAGRRNELFIVSKLAQYDHQPVRVRPAVEKVLRDLGVQYLDLFLLHWPEAQVPEMAEKDDFVNTLTVDNSITTLDTWLELEKCVDAGLIRSLGVSNFGLQQVEDLLAQARVKPVVNQVELTPFLPQRKLVGVCFRKGVQCVAYSPLGGVGLIAPNTLLGNPVVEEVAKEAGKTPAEVLLRWNLQRGVPVIPKAASPEHMKQNITTAFDWTLTAQQKNRLDSLENGYRAINPPWKKWEDPEQGGVAKPSRVITA